MTVSLAAGLRARLGFGSLLVAPGCHDPLSARQLQGAGFEAAYLGGFAAAAALGYPAPLVDLTEHAQAVGRVARVLGIPLITDADAGWGGPAQVRHTVEMLESAGSAGFHIEDHPIPKLLAYYSGEIQVVSRADLLAKVRVALSSRQNADTVVIGRTDAYAAVGGSHQEAVWRGQAMLEAGVDLIFLGGAVQESALRRIRDHLPEAPMMTIGHGDLPVSLYRELGFRLLVHPTASVVVSHRGVRETYARLAEAGLPAYDGEAYGQERAALARTLRIADLEALERSGLDS